MGTHRSSPCRCGGRTGPSTSRSSRAARCSCHHGQEQLRALARPRYPDWREAQAEEDDDARGCEECCHGTYVPSQTVCSSSAADAISPAGSTACVRSCAAKRPRRDSAPAVRHRGSIPGTTEGELLAACRELLRRGLPRAVARELDDEHGFIPIGVDVNGDVAATAFIRRLLRGAPAGRSGLETSEFQRRDSTWAYLGGGAGHFEEYPLV
jgi:hypothetical protein